MFADFRVAALAAGEIQFAALGAFADDQAAGLLPHFERLQQIDHVHFFEAALNYAGARRALLQFFEVQAIDDFFRDADQIFHEKWLDDEFFDAVDQRTQALFDICAACHKKKRNMTRFVAATEFFKKLAAVEARHFVVAEDDVGRLVDHFKQRVGAVGGDLDFADVIEALLDQIADERIVVDEEKRDAFAGGVAAALIGHRACRIARRISWRISTLASSHGVGAG